MDQLQHDRNNFNIMRKWTANQIRVLACRVRMEAEEQNVNYMQALKNLQVSRYCRPIVIGAIIGISGKAYEKTEQSAASKSKKNSQSQKSFKYKVSNNEKEMIESDDQLLDEQSNQAEDCNEDNDFEQNTEQVVRNAAIQILNVMYTKNCPFSKALTILHGCENAQQRKLAKFRQYNGAVIGLTGIRYEELRVQIHYEELRLHKQKCRNRSGIQVELLNKQKELSQLEYQVHELEHQKKLQITFLSTCRQYQRQNDDRRRQTEERRKNSQERLIQSQAMCRLFEEQVHKLKKDLSTLREEKQQLVMEVFNLQERQRILFQNVEVLERRAKEYEKRQ